MPYRPYQRRPQAPLVACHVATHDSTMLLCRWSTPPMHCMFPCTVISCAHAGPSTPNTVEPQFVWPQPYLQLPTLCCATLLLGWRQEAEARGQKESPEGEEWLFGRSGATINLLQARWLALLQACSQTMIRRMQKEPLHFVSLPVLSAPWPWQCSYYILKRTLLLSAHQGISLTLDRRDFRSMSLLRACTCTALHRNISIKWGCIKVLY